MKILLWLIALLVSGVLYRMGGYGKPFNTKFRDMGCPAVSLILLFILGITGVWWKVGISYFLTFGLMFGALTTYWDNIFKEDNFYAHGLMIGVAALPLMIIGVHWYSILLRAGILSGLMGLWSFVIKNDTLEEAGRGVLVVATLPLCLI